MSDIQFIGIGTACHTQEPNSANTYKAVFFFVRGTEARSKDEDWIWVINSDRVDQDKRPLIGTKSQLSQFLSLSRLSSRPQPTFPLLSLIHVLISDFRSSISSPLLVATSSSGVNPSRFIQSRDTIGNHPDIYPTGRCRDSDPDTPSLKILLGISMKFRKKKFLKTDFAKITHWIS
jgi:hypothetical protein